MIYLDGSRFFFDIEGCFSNLVTQARANAEQETADETAAEICKGFAKFFGTKPEYVKAGADYATVLKGIFATAPAVLIPEQDISFEHFASAFGEESVLKIKKAPDMKIKAENIAAFAEETGAEAIFLTNPCCPTAMELSAEEIKKLANLTEKPVIVDESYCVDETTSAIKFVPECENLTVLKKMRFGGEPIFACGKSLSSFDCGITAANQAAAAVIFNHDSALKTAQRKLSDSISSLYIRIKKLAIKYNSLERLYRSKANCVFFKVSDCENRVNALYEKGICVYRSEDYICVFAGEKDENEAVISALEEVLK